MYFWVVVLCRPSIFAMCHVKIGILYLFKSIIIQRTVFIPSIANKNGVIRMGCNHAHCKRNCWSKLLLSNKLSMFWNCFFATDMFCPFFYYRLWQRYDFHHTGLVNYKEFLHRLGVAVSNQFKPLPDNAKGGKHSTDCMLNEYLMPFSHNISVISWLSILFRGTLRYPRKPPTIWK